MLNAERVMTARESPTKSFSNGRPRSRPGGLGESPATIGTPSAQPRSVPGTATGRQYTMRIGRDYE
jgi:hypothetical protein